MHNVGAGERTHIDTHGVTTQVQGSTFNVQGSGNPRGLAAEFSASSRTDDWGQRRSGPGNCVSSSGRGPCSFPPSSNLEP